MTRQIPASWLLRLKLFCGLLLAGCVSAVRPGPPALGSGDPLAAWVARYGAAELLSGAAAGEKLAVWWLRAAVADSMHGAPSVQIGTAAGGQPTVTVAPAARAAHSADDFCRLQVWFDENDLATRVAAQGNACAREW